MVSYDEERCYWCGKFIGKDNMAYSSIATDTIKTMRNFCSKEHLLEFKANAKGKKTSLELIPYYGKENQI